MRSGPLFYRIMLWSLAAAAACGVLAMLTASFHTLGRVSATALATAIAAGVAWGVGDRREDPLFRDSRSVAIGATVVCYLFGLLGIWNVAEPETWLTAMVTAMATPIAVFCLRVRYFDQARLAGWAGLGISILAWLTSLVSIWGRNSQDKWIGTTLVLAGFGILASACLVNVTRKRFAAIPWIGTAASVLAGTILLLEIWDWVGGSQFHERIIIVLASVGLVVAHANLCRLAPLPGRQKLLQASTIAAAVLTAACVDLLTIFEIRGDSMFGRLAGAAAIATGCGTLAIAMLQRYNRATSTDTADDGSTPISQITLLCPRCQLKQTVALGEIGCARCGLRLQIRINTDPGDESPGDESPAAAAAFTAKPQATRRTSTGGSD